MPAENLHADEGGHWQLLLPQLVQLNDRRIFITLRPPNRLPNPAADPGPVVQWIE